MSTNLYTNMTEQVNFGGRNSVFYLEDVIQIKATIYEYINISHDFPQSPRWMPVECRMWLLPSTFFLIHHSFIICHLTLHKSSY
jgi:hypothetical protein